MDGCGVELGVERKEEESAGRCLGFWREWRELVGPGAGSPPLLREEREARPQTEAHGEERGPHLTLQSLSMT